MKIFLLAQDRKQARREAAYQIGFYMSTRSYGGMMDFHNWHKEKEAIRVAFFEKRDMEAVADAVSDDMIDTPKPQPAKFSASRSGNASIIERKRSTAWPHE